MEALQIQLSPAIVNNFESQFNREDLEKSRVSQFTFCMGATSQVKSVISNIENEYGVESIYVTNF